MSWSNAKKALQPAPARPDPGLRGRRPHLSASPRRPRSCSSPSRPSAGRSAALEEHLGVALFERRPRSLALTEQGRALQRAATELLERLQERHRPAARRRRRAAPDRHHHQRLCLAVADPAPARLHRAAPRRRCAHLRQLQDASTWSAAWSTWRCAIARRRRRRRAPSACSARSCFPICSPALLDGGRASAARARRTWRTTRCCTWTSAGGYFDWDTWLAAQGHRGSEAGGLPAVRQLRADDQRRAERPGRRHGHRPAGAAA